MNSQDRPLSRTGHRADAYLAFAVSHPIDAVTENMADARSVDRTGRFGVLRWWKRLVLIGAGFASGADLWDPAEASDFPTKAVPADRVYNWTGFYVGGHVGYGGGSFGPGTNPLPKQGVFFPHSLTGLIGGYQAGYNRQLPNNVVIGAETDISFPSPVDRPRLVPAPFNTTFDYFGTARGRVGYAFGTVLPYVTAGAAWGRTRVDINGSDGSIAGTKFKLPLGWVAGVGIEFAIGGNWSAKGEYNYIDLGSRTFGFDRPAIARYRGRTQDPYPQARIELQALGRPALGGLRSRRERPIHNAGVDGLERAWPDHRDSPRISALPFALSRH